MSIGSPQIFTPGRLFNTGGPRISNSYIFPILPFSKTSTPIDGIRQRCDYLVVELQGILNPYGGSKIAAHPAVAPHVKSLVQIARQGLLPSKIDVGDSSRSGSLDFWMPAHLSRKLEFLAQKVDLRIKFTAQTEDATRLNLVLVHADSYIPGIKIDLLLPFIANIAIELDEISVS